MSPDRADDYCSDPDDYREGFELNRLANKMLREEKEKQDEAARTL
jgi:hypothetical protein